MNRTFKLAIGAAAVIAIVLGGVVVLGRLGSTTSPTSSPTSTDLSSKIPETFGDVVMSVSPTDAATYIRLNPSSRLAPILTALGKTDADVEVATGKRAGATPLILIDAVRIDGTDASALFEAFETAVADAPGVSATTTTLNGKVVITWEQGSGTTAVYGKDDVLYILRSPDADLVSQALGSLP